MKSLEKDSKQTNINARSPTFNHASSAPGYHQSWMSNANSLFDKSSTNSKKFAQKSIFNVVFILVLASAAQKQKYVHTSDAYTRRSQSPIQSNRMQTSPHYSTSQFPFKGIITIYLTSDLLKAGRSISQGRIVTTGYISTTTTQGMGIFINI